MTEQNNALFWQCVILAGNLSDGYWLIGPFDDFDTAADYCEQLDHETWVMHMNKP